MPKGFDYRKVYLKPQVEEFDLITALRERHRVITRDGRKVLFLSYNVSIGVITGAVNNQIKTPISWNKDGRFCLAKESPMDLCLKPINR